VAQELFGQQASWLDRKFRANRAEYDQLARGALSELGLDNPEVLVFQEPRNNPTPQLDKAVRMLMDAGDSQAVARRLKLLKLLREQDVYAAYVEDKLMPGET